MLLKPKSEPASSVLRILQLLLIKLSWNACLHRAGATRDLTSSPLLSSQTPAYPLVTALATLGSWPFGDQANELLSWVRCPCGTFYPERPSCQYLHSSSWLKACRTSPPSWLLSKMASSSLYPDPIFLNVIYFHLALLIFLLCWGSFGHAAQLVGCQFPQPGRELGCRWGKHQVLTTQLSEHSSSGLKIYIYSYVFMYLLIAFLLQ